MKNRLYELRLEKNVKQQDIANFIKCSRQGYANYENGARDPDNDTLVALADYFNVSVDYLLGRTDKRFTSDKTFTTEQLRLLNAFDALIPPMQEYILEMVEKLVEQPQNTVKRA